MHAVNRNKLLGKGVWNGLMVNARTGNPADGFASLRNASDCLGKSLTNDAPPVCAHGDLKSRMSQDRWSPLNRMDLGHQSTIDNARLVEDLITAKCQLLSNVGHGCTHPVQLGCPLRIASQIVLCSKANRVCNISTPSHQLSLKPVFGVPSSALGINRRSLPTSSSSNLPWGCPLRKLVVTASLDP